MFSFQVFVVLHHEGTQENDVFYSFIFINKQENRLFFYETIIGLCLHKNFFPLFHDKHFFLFSKKEDQDDV